MTVFDDIIMIHDSEIDRSKLTNEQYNNLCAVKDVKQIAICPKIWSFPNTPEILAIFKSIGVKEKEPK